MEKKPYYISTAIAYTSAKPHIGNTYEIILADAIARYKRMAGFDVYFQTGTDEHGQKIQEKAEAAGITPQQHVDNVSTRESMWANTARPVSLSGPKASWWMESARIADGPAWMRRKRPTSLK